MAGTTITPTRMMLKQLKGRLKTARQTVNDISTAWNTREGCR